VEVFVACVEDLPRPKLEYTHSISVLPELGLSRYAVLLLVG
jgi:hypothetical protein